MNTKTYFIRAGDNGPVKIGISADPEKRLRGLQTAQPDKLKLLGVLSGDHESKLHRQFNDLRLHGEWFRPAATLLEFIEASFGTGTTAICDEFLPEVEPDSGVAELQPERDKQVFGKLMQHAHPCNCTPDPEHDGDCDYLTWLNSAHFLSAGDLIRTIEIHPEERVIEIVLKKCAAAEYVEYLEDVGEAAFLLDITYWQILITIPDALSYTKERKLTGIGLFYALCLSKGAA